MHRWSIPSIRCPTGRRVRPGERARSRSSRLLAELVAAWGFAGAQPILDLFGRAPERFVFHGAGRLDAVAFAAVVAFVPPLALWSAGFVAGRLVRSARRPLHLVALGGLVVGFVLQVGRPRVDGAVLAGVAIGAAALGLLAYRRFAPMRLWLAYAAVAPVVFAVLFLTTSDTARLYAGTPGAAASEPPGDPVPVVMVVFDELPLASLVDADGAVDAATYPNFGELAGRSHWFRNATTVSSATWHAVPAMLTGVEPRDGTAPIVADHPDNLFTLLDGPYDLHVVETVSQLCPPTTCPPVGAGAGGLAELLRDAALRTRAAGATDDTVRELVEPVVDAGDEDELTDPERAQPARVRAFLDGLGPGDASLHYLHVLLPHVPFRYLPSGVRYPPPDPPLGREMDRWADEPWLVDLARQRHLLQVAYVDAVLGEILDELGAAGLDDALLVVTADHGIAFEAGSPGRALHDHDIDDGIASDLAWVPLFVRLPGQDAGAVHDANVSLLDLVPTIAEVLDLEVPWPTDGRSLFGPAREDPLKTLVLGEVGGPSGVTIGGEYRIDTGTGADLVRERSAANFVPDAPEGDGIWRIGSHPELVGVPVEAAPAAVEVEPLAVELADPAAPADVDPGEEVPALVRGWLPDGTTRGSVAVAVNGVIGAAVPTFDDDGRLAFAAMVGDERFVPGPNAVTVHRVVP